MYFLHTIEEDDESQALLQESEGGGQKESDEPSPHGIRTSRERHEADSGRYKATMADSESQREPVWLEKHTERQTGLAPSQPRNLHDDPNKRLSSSTARSSTRRSSSAQETRDSSAARSPNRGNSSTPRHSRGPSSSTQRSSLRRTSSAQSSPSSSITRAIWRSRIARRKFGPVKGKTSAQKRTGKKARSTTPRRAAQKPRRPINHTRPTPEHDDLPAPQWVINLMFDIEEATMHELTVE